MTRLVIQKTPHDCGLACAAMAIGKPYSRLWLKRHIDLTYSRPGLYVSDLLDFMTERSNLTRDDFLVVRLNDRRTAGAMVRWRPAILMVPSLNNEGGRHFVYWDGERIWDPSPKQRYRLAHTAELSSEAILINPQAKP